MDKRFELVGPRPVPAPRLRRGRWYEGKPVLSGAILGGIVLGCLLCGLFIEGDPGYMDFYHADCPPGPGAWFGTDSMGRDIFAMIWYGGRVSLFIGFLAAAVSAVLAVVFGSVSGLAPRWLDGLLMRLTEILLSVPSLLLVIFLQAVLGEATAVSIALVIGATSWTSIAKVVRTEVRQLRGSGYVAAARCMGAGFGRILWRHLTPNLLPSIMFMVVMNIRAAIVAESTLSFMGIGLPLETVSWGSMLSLSEKALLSGSWWTILIPGAFLVTAMLCVTDIGNYLRRSASRRESNL